MIRQVKPPALFSVDLSNVPAASCSIIMVSSPLLLRRQCLSPLGPSSRFASSSSSPLPRRLLILRLRRSSYCFLFLFRPSTLAYPPVCTTAPFVLLLAARPTNTTSSTFLLSSPGPPDAAVTRITRIVSKTANNKCFSALRNIVKFLPTLPILPYVRAIFPESRKLNVRGNWRIIRVSQLRGLAAL